MRIRQEKREILKFEEKLKLEFRLAKVKERPIIAPFPKTMMIETTNVCNLSCIYCKNPLSFRKKGFIEMELFENIIQQAREAGVEEIGLYTIGEPLIHKECSEHIRFAKKEGIRYVYISSNGTLCNAELAKNIIDAGLDSLKFTISGGTRESYLEIHGYDLFEQVLSNLKTIDRLRKEKNANLKIAVSCVLTKQNINEKDILKQILKPYVDTVIFNPVTHLAGQMLKQNENLYITGSIRKKITHVICAHPWNRVHVTYNGLLTLCCADFEDELIYGDLKKESLIDAWNNKKMQTWRVRHLNNDLEGTICNECLKY